MNDPPPPPARRPFRWQALLQRAADPVFVLDRRRRLLFVNRAWEQLTGLAADRARGLLCRQPRPSGPDDILEDLLAHVHTPPAETMRGQPGRVRRLFVRRTRASHQEGGGPPPPPAWWDVEFLPVRQPGSQETYLFLGRIVPVPPAEPPAVPLLPERLGGLRLARAERFSPALLDSGAPAMGCVAEQVRLAAGMRNPLAILGEPGAGKRTTARIVHQASPAREKPFVALDCRRLPAAAVTTLLFGRAGLVWSHPGTLYLGEPDCLPREVQQRLVELFPATEDLARPRLIAGLSRPPQELLAGGGLLPDLHWRLSVFVVSLPPLRERTDDLRPLVEGVLAGQTKEGEPAVTRLTSQAWDALRAYPWPGNLRELRQVIVAARRHAVAANPADTTPAIDAADLPLVVRLANQDCRPAGARPVNLDEVLTQVERRLILQTLQKVRGNQSRAAELLGIPRARLLRRLAALGIDEGTEGTLEIDS